MEFWTTLIEANTEQTARAIESLSRNCTYVDNNYWIFEGDVEALEDDGVDFVVHGEGAVPSLGDMNQDDLVELCVDVFGVDVRTE